MNLNIWKGTKIYGKFSSSNYLDLNLTKNPTNCGEGNKMCGILDTIGNHLCILKEEECPINILEFNYEDNFAKKNLFVNWLG